jgi:carbon-monoxide dehydrogenase large subunit
VISPDVGGGFGYKGLLCREEVALAWLARRTGDHVRWLEDCREHLTGNANCREHHYRLTGYADRDGRLLALDCEARSTPAPTRSIPPPRRSNRRRSPASCRAL